MAARKSLGNATVTYNAVNITQYLKQSDLDSTVNRLETTNLTSTGAESIADSTTYSVSFNGFWDKALDDVIAPDVITLGTQRTAIITFVGSTGTVTYTWTSKAEIENWKISAAAGQFISCSGALALNGAPVRS
jgi:hypothetical protein